MSTEGIQKSDFDKRSLAVAANFLQTAVILDDLAEMGRASSNSIDHIPTGTIPISKPSLSDLPQENLDDIPQNSSAGLDAPLDAKVVIDGFAKNGIVCGVLRPDSVEPNDTVGFPQMVAKAAKRTDILVLDWKLGSFTEGEATLAIIREILEGDSPSTRLRLLAIYTGEPNLAEISEKISPVIIQSNPGVDLDSDDPMVLIQGPLRVAIFAKTWAAGSVREDLKNRIVAEEDLPNRLIQEFSEMTRGLLSNVAVAGLTALREEAHRLLAQFGIGLDAGYLGHRILLPHPPDAEDHLHEALSAELLSILQERGPANEAGIEAIREWLYLRQDQGLDLKHPVNLPQQPDHFATWTKLLGTGNGTGDEKLLSNSKWEQLKGKSTEIFVKTSSDAIDSNQRFSYLLGFKTRYSMPVRRLTLGTVLSFLDSKGTSYFLCLQPKCDSVRLQGRTGFPLLPLTVQDNAQGNARFRMVLMDSSQHWLYFDYSPKPRDLVIRNFDPDPYPPGEVIASKCAEEFFFKDSGGSEYTWVAEMKDEQALRVAAELATSLSRPGPNDAEWLRLASPARNN